MLGGRHDFTFFMTISQIPLTTDPLWQKWSLHCHHLKKKRTTYNWKKLFKKQILESYPVALDDRLKEIRFPSTSDNPSTLEEYLKNIRSAMHKACAKTIPSKALLKHKRPGWNSSANAVHRHSKAAWKLWKASGKPNCPTNPIRKSYLIFYGGATLVTHMTTLFHQIVEQEYIPQIFQHGLIIPIPKSYNKDPSDSSNYRGITLLS